MGGQHILRYKDSMLEMVHCGRRQAVVVAEVPSRIGLVINGNSF